MAIKFHCEHCGKSISAPDDAGGKKGRCPSCKDVVYVPSGETDELALAPVDEEAERQRQRLIDENLRKEHDLLMAQARREAADEPSESDALDDVHGEGGVVLSSLAGAGPAEASGPSVGRPAGHDLRNMLAQYLAFMADGQLDQADAIVRQLKADPKSARVAIDQFLADPTGDPAARLARVPRPVINGFIKQLQQALK